MATQVLLREEDRSESPAKPKDDADEPKEVAKDCLGDASIKTETQDKMKGDPEDPLPPTETDGKEEIKVKKENDSMDVDAEDANLQPGGVLTKEMIEEEKQMHQQTIKEEQKMWEKGHQEILDLDDHIREQRYKRLQFLLSKSNMYTKYLLERMERQQKEEQKKKEKADIKAAKEAEKKAAEEKAKKEQETEAEKQTGKQGEPASLSSPSASGRSSRRGNSNTPTPVTSPAPGRTRNGKANATENSQEISPKPGKRGRKRKADESEQYKIADFFDGMGLKAKKAKTEENTGSENTNKESQVSQSEEKVNSTVLTRMYKGEEIPVDQPALFTNGILRNYQIEGFRWLQCLYENGVNGILADEMGLGKTIQCIAAIADLVLKGVCGPYLVVAPLSTLPNWMAEFARFTPKIPVILYHGSKDNREKARKKILHTMDIKKGVTTHPVVVTSYEMAMNDRKMIQNYAWKYLIVDEGHRIKNFQCRLIKELKMYRSTHRLLLTGTPLQNNLSELWSLLNFLLPEIFDDLGSFESWFDIQYISEAGADEKIVAQEQQQNILSMLHQILTPFLLRRLKSDVDLKIPPKREILVYAPLSKVQKEYYEATVNKSIFQVIESKNEKPEKVEVDTKGRPVRRATRKKVNYEIMMQNDKDEDEDDKAPNDGNDEELDTWVKSVIEEQEKRTSDSSTPAYNAGPKKSVITIRLQNVMMQLRKCCNHPYLLEYPLTPDGNYKVDEEVIKKCGKMMLLDKMLGELKKKGHKVLIFSQMTKMLDILEDYCYLRDYKYSRLDGSRSVEDRKEQMESFSKDEEVFLFLLSTRAGGLGINLTAADTVIIYDSDWNPQSDLQAQDRCHRIGQTRPVVVYRLVAANTYDQKVVERAAAKRKLEKMVIHKGKFKSGLKSFNESLNPLSPQELLALLKTQDHDEVVQGREGHVINKRDLDQLLDRSDLYDVWLNKQEAEQGKGKMSSPKARKSNKVNSKEVKGVFKVIDEEEGHSTFEGLMSPKNENK